jgi:hypothetical protein
MELLRVPHLDSSANHKAPHKWPRHTLTTLINREDFPQVLTKLRVCMEHTHLLLVSDHRWECHLDLECHHSISSSLPNRVCLLNKVSRLLRTLNSPNKRLLYSSSSLLLAPRTGYHHKLPLDLLLTAQLPALLDVRPR